MSKKSSENLLTKNQKFVRLLKESRLFNHLPEKLIQQLEPLSHFIELPKRETIIKEGTVINKIYFIFAGKVGVYSKGEHIATLKRKGDIFGEMSLISNKPCVATIVSESPLQVFSIPTDAIGNYAEIDTSALQNMIYRVFAMTLTEKLSLTTIKARQYETTNEKLKKLTESLHFRIKLEKHVASISSQFINLSPEQTIMEVNLALKKTSNFIGAKCGYMLIFSGDGTEVEQIYEWYSKKGNKEAKNNEKGSVDLLKWFEEKMKKNEETIQSSVTHRPFLCIPVIYEETIVGFLGFDNITQDKGGEQDEDLTMLRMIGEILVTALKHSQAEKERKQTERKAYIAGMAENAISVLHNIGNAITPTIVNLKNLSNKKGSDTNTKYLIQFKEKLSEQLKGGDIEQYLQKDKKGKQMLPFLESLIQEMAKQQRQELKVIDTIEDQLNHIVEIISLQQKYANFESTPIPCQIPVVISDVIEMMRGDFDKRNLQVHQRIESSIPQMVCDKNKLVQVLLNLFKNALEGIDEHLSKNASLSPEIIINVSLAKNKFVCFSIQDNGIGVPQETINHLFEFGYTTKSRGSGFGLHSCANFIRSQGGNISLSSEGKTRGTTVQFTLPIQGRTLEN